MMKKLLLFLLAATLLAFPALALAESELTVIGTATVTLPADMAEFSVGVETHAATVHEAAQQNNLTLAAVMEALTDAGIDVADLSTSNYYVYAEYDYSATPAQMVGYSVSNTLTVVVRDIERIGAVIDAATSAGANQVYGVTFRSSGQAEAYDRALTQAVAEGARKAQLLAAASGHTLGELETITENGSQTYGVVMAKETADRAAGTAILPEELSVTATVTLTYGLR